ncbi:MAG: right-handed parallel beta-helix repeat-containing protein [Thermoanaerobaculia bacterium]|nr:right-handed parallel beta-helix repeat-containing protein [Thermoanaerobaculia bacterium]
MHRSRNIAWAGMLGLLLGCASVNGAEYFVSPSGDDADPGTLEAPFRTFHRGIDALNDGDPGDTLTLREGVYRLMEEQADPPYARILDHEASEQVRKTVRAFPGEKVQLLGSLSTAEEVWAPADDGLWRLPALFLSNDPSGMWTGERRVEHRSVLADGIRRHAPISQLTDPGSWTKADDLGAGCDESNDGCYIYMRPLVGEDPTSEIYELAQEKILEVWASYVVIEGIEFLYSQGYGVLIAGGSGQRGHVLRGNRFCHNAAPETNAYLVFSAGGGVLIEGNEACDSAYWGGTPNSRGITFITTDPEDPSTVRGNYIHGIPGPAIGSKNGVSGLLVEKNIIRDSFLGVEPARFRCHWKGCDPPDGFNYPGGGWVIRENIFIGNQNGVGALFSVSPDGGDVIYNNTFIGNDRGIHVKLRIGAEQYHWEMENNIFVGNERGIFLNQASGELIDLEDTFASFDSDHNLFFGNTHDIFLRPNDAGGPDYGTSIDAEEMQIDHGREMNSVAEMDPMFIDSAEDNYYLHKNSPAREAGDGTRYGVAAVDMGAYPFGDGIFADGFESGNTTSWSVTHP